MLNRRPHFIRLLLLLPFIFLAMSLACPALLQPPDFVRMAGRVPTEAVGSAADLERVAPDEMVRLTLAFPLRNRDSLDDLLGRLYNPADPLCGRYLTPDDFTGRIGPLPSDYDRVAAYVSARGLSVTAPSPSREKG